MTHFTYYKHVAMHGCNIYIVEAIDPMTEVGTKVGPVQDLDAGRPVATACLQHNPVGWLDSSGQQPSLVTLVTQQSHAKKQIKTAKSQL